MSLRFYTWNKFKVISAISDRLCHIPKVFDSSLPDATACIFMAFCVIRKEFKKVRFYRPNAWRHVDIIVGGQTVKPARLGTWLWHTNGTHNVVFARIQPVQKRAVCIYVYTRLPQPGAHFSVVWRHMHKGIFHGRHTITSTSRIYTIHVKTWTHSKNGRRSDHVYTESDQPGTDSESGR